MQLDGDIILRVALFPLHQKYDSRYVFSPVTLITSSKVVSPLSIF